MKTYRSYEDARKYVQSLKIKSIKEYRQYWKIHLIPDDLPKSPHAVYKNKGWTTWGDFLGTGRIADMYKHRQLLSWKEAKSIYRRLAKEYGLKNREDWKKFAKKHGKELDEMHLAKEPWSAYSKENVWRKMK